MLVVDYKPYFNQITCHTVRNDPNKILAKFYHRLGDNTCSPYQIKQRKFSSIINVIHAHALHTTETNRLFNIHNVMLGEKK